MSDKNIQVAVRIFDYMFYDSKKSRPDQKATTGS